MSAHSLAGLAALNALYLASGVAILWVARGWVGWSDVARLAGLAYLVGVVAMGSLWTVLLIVGVPFSLWSMLGLFAVVIAVAAIAARRRGPTLPARRTHGGAGRLLATAVGISASALLLAGSFRGARLSGLYWWDAWAFWVPKAKVIYYFGSLDADLFTELPGSSYPPLVPVLDAAAFHAMRSPDVVTLHVQYWLFGVGFVWALAGLLAERVPDWILWPFVLLALVAPRIGTRFFITEADLFLDCLFVLACVLVFTWLLDGDRWRLATATVLMCGMVLTKREGMLLVALLLLTTFAASARDWRVAWRSLGVATGVVVLVAAPWRVWYVAHGVSGETPSGGLSPVESAERFFPSFRLAFDVLFSSHYWSVLIPVAIGALVLALLARGYLAVFFFGLLLLLVTLAGGWITWAIPELEISQELGANPIVRYMGAAALLCAAATPLLLATAWRAVTSRGA